MDTSFYDVIRSFGASDCGVAAVSDGPEGLPYALSVVVRLSDAIVDEIIDEPTYTYFNHYRSVNTLIDQILLRLGLALQSRGARYVTVAASQSRPDSPYEGRYSHKKAACLAGLGSLGQNNLFLHRAWGARVRLGTVFTDWEGCIPCLSEYSAVSSEVTRHPACNGCDRCVSACPSGAIVSVGGTVSFSAKTCSDWMKTEYQRIGRGSVCGICMRVCPAISVYQKEALS